MDAATPCRWCLSARGVVMIGEEETGILLCPRCDFANALSAGPPCESRVRDVPPKP
jgi:hypothetical protein